MPVSLNRIDPKKHYSLRDLLSWNSQDRYELIDGVPYLMTNPSSWHQTVSMNLSALIWNYIRSSNSHCRVYTAPMGLLLFNSEDDLESENIVQPDIFVLCDGKLGKWSAVCLPGLWRCCRHLRQEKIKWRSYTNINKQV